MKPTVPVVALLLALSCAACGGSRDRSPWPQAWNQAERDAWIRACPGTTPDPSTRGGSIVLLGAHHFERDERGIPVKKRGCALSYDEQWGGVDRLAVMYTSKPDGGLPSAAARRQDLLDHLVGVLPPDVKAAVLASANAPHEVTQTVGRFTTKAGPVNETFWMVEVNVTPNP
jgi:hypothetical protein